MNRITCGFVIALASVLTGCATPVSSISLIGDTSVESRVTTEEYAPNFSTESAAEAEPEKKEASRTNSADARKKEQEEKEGISASDPSRRTLTDDVNLREGPSTDDVILGIVPKGAHVSLQRVEGEWYYVRYMSYYGYVKSGFFEEGDEDENSPYLNPKSEEASEADSSEAQTQEATAQTTEASNEAQSENKEKKQVVLAEGLEILRELNVTRVVSQTVNLRDPADPEQIMTIVPAGETVAISAALSEEWYLVEYNEMTGIVKGGFFTEENP